MAAPELRLNVTLDLAFFRTQVQKLTAITQSEFAPRLNVKFNRQTLDTELNNLQRAIKRRVYRIEIGGNIDALPKKIQGIKEGLAALETQKKVEIPIGIKNGVTQEDATTVVAAMYRKIRESGLENTGGKIRIPVSIKPSITKKDVTDFKKAVKDSLSGITVNVKANVQGGGFAGSAEGAAGLMEYMKKEGMIGKTASGMQMRMKNESNDKGRIQRSALDQLARAIFFMAGIDPSQIRAKRRQIPDVDWASTIPSRPPSIGPSSGGRALPFGAIPSSLPGTAFGSQKYLPTALGEELKQILRGAAYAFVDSFKQNIRTVKVTESPQSLLGGRVPAGLLPGRPSQTNVLELNNILAGAIREYFKAVARGVTAQAGGAFKPTKRSLLPGARVAGLLTPSVGRTPSRYSTAGETTQELFARREREARMRSALRSVDTLREGGVAGRAPSPYSTAYRGARSREAIVPYSAGGALVRSGGGGAPPSPQSTQLGAGYYAAGKGLSSIKSAYGQVQQILNTKQLPLSGAIGSLAGEFGNAIKQVLLFGTAYKALAFLTSLPGEAFEAAKGLATYKNQLKAVTSESQTFDQSLAFVDNLAQRFNTPLESARQGFVKLYASMQPAGFNQVEIENLFTGISKAAAAFGLSSDKVDRVNYAFAQMASKGQIMSEELKGQLGDVLPGALGLFARAAQMSIPEFTKAMEDGAFQGKAMQQVLGNVAILMNSQYGPAAEGAAKTLQGAVNKIQNNLKLMYESFGPIVDKFAAAFGPEINSLINDVSLTVKALTGNFSKAGEGFDALSPRAQSFYTAIRNLEPSLRQAGAALVDLGGRFAVLVPYIVQAISAAISFASTPLGRGALLAAAAIGTLTAALKLLQVTGIQAAVKWIYTFIGALMGIPVATGAARIGVIALKLAITGLVLGGILMGLDFLIGKLLGVGDAAAKSKKEIQELDRELDAMAGAGDLEGTTKAYLEANTNLAKASKESKVASEKVAKMKAAAQIVSGDTNEENARSKMANDILIAQAEKESEKAFNRELLARKLLQSTRTARDTAKNIKERQNEESLKEQGKLEKIDLSGSDKDKKTSLESYYNLEDQLAKASTQAEIDRAQMIFDHQTKLMNLGFDLREARANSFQKDAIRFQRELAQIEQERANAMFKARSDVLLAQGSVAGGTRPVGGATGGATGAGIIEYISGDPSRADYRPDHGTIERYHDHIAFATRELAIAAYKKLTAAGLKVTEFQGYGKGVTGPHSGPGSLHHKGLAMDVPGYQHGGSGPIGAKEYAGSARVRAVLGIGGAGSGAAGAGAPRKVPGSEKRDILAEQAAENALRKEKLLGLQEEEFYYKRIAVAIANYAASIFSPEEQQLQNNLLEKRNNLIKQGASKDVIDFEMERYEMQEKFKNGIEVANKKIEENNALVSEGRMSQEKATEQNAIHNNTIEELTKNLNQVNPLLERKNKLTKDGAFLTAMASLKNRLAIAKAPTEDAARREELKQEGYRDDEIPRMMAIEEEIARLEELNQKSSDIASSISESITGAFKNIVTGSMAMQEALAGSFRSIGDYFADMVMKMIADYLKLSMIQGIKNILSMFAPGVAAGGGFALGGPGGQGAAGSYGSAMSPTSSLPSFTGGAGFQPVSMGAFGIQEFASGGIVQGPTLGLVGEGRYNEAIIPLPDGKSVPVQLAGGSEGTSAPINTNIVVNVKNGQSDSQVTGNQGNQLGREIEGAVRQVILKEIRPGGIIYSSR